MHKRKRQCASGSKAQGACLSTNPQIHHPLSMHCLSNMELRLSLNVPNHTTVRRHGRLWVTNKADFVQNVCCAQREEKGCAPSDFAEESLYSLRELHQLGRLDPLQAHGGQPPCQALVCRPLYRTLQKVEAIDQSITYEQWPWFLLGMSHTDTDQ